MAFAEDLTPFFDEEEFASRADWGSVVLAGIFDAPFRGTAMGGSVVENEPPQFICRTADVETIAHGDELVIEETTYKVVGIQPDGTGVTTLILQEDR